MWQLWAVLAVLGLILELTSGDFFIMCIAIGAMGAAIVVRPFALRYLQRKGNDRVSNADALLGRIARVKTTIQAKGTGYVAIDGDLWKAVSADDEEIAEGTRVKVVGRESTIVTVEKMD